jgi:hypothetical protein
VVPNRLSEHETGGTAHPESTTPGGDDHMDTAASVRKAIFFVLALVAFEAFLIIGIVSDHFLETLSNGAMICLSCIGVG